MEAHRVYFSGRVQGVGFRFNTVDVAKQFDVTGYVRNLADGRVELLAEGEPKVVEAFVDAVCGRMQSFIRSHTIDRSEIGSRAWRDFAVSHEPG